jgi:MFS family permease
MGKGLKSGTNNEKMRIYSGAGFGFLQNIMSSFGLLLLPMYFSSLDIDLVTYAFLLSIGDVFSFILKPIIGYYTDKYGERKFLLIGVVVLTLSLFLIGQATDLIQIVILKIISSVAGAVMLVLILIYGLRSLGKNPDKQVGLFRSIFSAGWIFGLLLPGISIDNFGIDFTFYLVLLVGLIWLILTFILTKKIERKKQSFKPSLSFIKKVPLPMIYKIVDISIFNAFLFFFTRYSLKTLGLSRGIVSMIVIAEVFVFSLGQFFLGRISNRKRRKYWIPIAMIMHIIAIITIVYSSELIHYFIASGLFGLGGVFVDIWIYSRISETVKKQARSDEIMNQFR